MGCSGINSSFVCFLESVHALHNESIHAGYISPVLKRVATLHNFTIESQVRYYGPLAFDPIPINMNNNTVYGLSEEDLTVFVNSEEWTLCSYTQSFVNPAALSTPSSFKRVKRPRSALRSFRPFRSSTTSVHFKPTR
jgi:hypothetical protein